jgi:hypothetical protein
VVNPAPLDTTRDSLRCTGEQVLQRRSGIGMPARQVAELDLKLVDPKEH